MGHPLVLRRKLCCHPGRCVVAARPRGRRFGRPAARAPRRRYGPPKPPARAPSSTFSTSARHGPDDA